MSLRVLDALIGEWEDIDDLIRTAVSRISASFPFHIEDGRGVGSKTTANLLESSAELMAYTKVHAFVGQYRAVESYHHLHLLKEMLRVTVYGWAEQMCTASQHVLRFPSHCSDDVSGSGSLSWCTSESKKRWETFRKHVRRRWRGQKHHSAHRKSTSLELVATGVSTPVPSNSTNERISPPSSPFPIASFVNVAATTQPLNHCDRSKKALQLHMAVTFSVHYYAFRRVLQTVLLPIQQSVTYSSLLDETLLALVKRIVVENASVFLTASLTAADYLLMRDSPCARVRAVGEEEDCVRTTTSPETKNPYPHHAPQVAMREVVNTTFIKPLSDSSTMNMEHSASLVSVLLKLVEECGNVSIQYQIASALHRMCFTSGEVVSKAAFRSCLLDNNASLDVAHAALAPLSVHHLKEVVEALGQCIDGYRRTRGAILVFAGAESLPGCNGRGGVPQPSQSLSPWGQLFLNSAFQGYVAGVAAVEQLEIIVEMTAVPLWLQACQEAYKSKHGEDRLEELHQIRVLQSDFLQVGSEFSANGAEEKMDKEHPPQAEGTTPAFLLHPSDGYPSMLFLLSAIEQSRKRFLPVLRRCVAAYFSEQLQYEDEVGGNDPHDSSVLLPLPPIVVEQCIYVLKMTRQCFESDPIQRVTLVERQLRLPHPHPHPYPATSVVNPVPGLTSLLEVAMETAWGGIREFFLSCEKRAAATLAHTLDYHVDCIVARQASYVPDIHDDLHSEAVHTLLDLATLLTDGSQFTKIYADLIAPKIVLAPTLASLDVYNWVVTLMDCHLGYTNTSPCFLLLRDVMEALQDQRYVCSKYPEPSGRGDVVLHGPPTSLNPGNRSVGPSRAGDGISSPNGGTLRLSLGSLASLSARHNPLLRRLNVLRFTRWKPYATLLQSSKSIIKMFERGGYLSEDFVDAVLRAEWCYDGNHARAYQGYGSFRFLRNPLGSILSNGSVEGEDDSRSSIARISQSTSSMVVGLSSALTSAVQQAAQNGGLAAFTSNGSLGNDDYDDDAAFSGAYGGVLRQEASASYPTTQDGNGSFSSRHSQTSRHTNHSSYLSSISDTSLRVEEKRKIRWSLGIGTLTFTIKEVGFAMESHHHTQGSEGNGMPKGNRRERAGVGSGAKQLRVGAPTVTVTGPPVCLIILQLLNRMTSRTSPLSFSLLVSYLPLKVPKEVVAQVLKSFLSAGLVQRVLEHQSYAYFITPTLSSVPRRVQVTVQYKNTHLDPHSSSHNAGGPLPGRWGTTPFPDHSSSMSQGYHPASPPSLPTPSDVSSPTTTHPENRETTPVGSSGSVTSVTAEKIQHEKNRWRVDIIVMRQLKGVGRTVPHEELFHSVAKHFDVLQLALTPAMFKASISYLLERDCIFRNEGNAYTVIRPSAST